ncbi:MAG TPA: rubrerythrin family protein [Tissierellia bacterium]|nr:rubrerythrin family protein [Tissierellia bacterium]
MSIKGTKTEQNLLKAFAGESQARGRYTMFAKKARQEGYYQIADFFDETARNEYEHSKQFFKYLEGGDVEITAMYPAGKVGTTAENLQAAADGENEEHTTLYPGFAEVAKEEGFKDVATTFLMVARAEVAHEDRFLKLKANILDNKVFKREDKVVWKCGVCGYLHEGYEPPQVCPSCKHDREHFELMVENY